MEYYHPYDPQIYRDQEPQLISDYKGELRDIDLCIEDRNPEPPEWFLSSELDEYLDYCRIEQGLDEEQVEQLRFELTNKK